jgi:2-polyprenyl-6-methoxyphenol hydroxylase-like FAD-dependent oxidoreductase
MRVLISGAGIVGPTLAYWLQQYGLQPTIVERAPALRTSGYIIDFWGVGFDVAERIGLLPAIRREGYMVREVRVMGRDGNRVAGFPVDAVARIANRRYIDEILSRTPAIYSGPLEAGEDLMSISIGDSVTITRYGEQDAIRQRTRQ